MQGRGRDRRARRARGPARGVLTTERTGAREVALRALLVALRARGYDFVTPTPATHARVVARAAAAAPTLRDVLGWSRPFHADQLEPEILSLLRDAEAIATESGMLRSTLRVSRLAGDLYLHSAYPTTAADAVFFGPDTYRFARFLRSHVAKDAEIGRMADIGAGTGAGALSLARQVHVRAMVLTDTNPAALALARVHVADAGLSATFVETRGLDGVEGDFDLVVANPPYIVDAAGRAYRDGGGLYGGQASVDMARAAVEKLHVGGRLALYTGAAIVEGENLVVAALVRLATETRCRIEVEELDPDVFGEELDGAPYADVERIAAVGVVLTKS